MKSLSTTASDIETERCGKFIIRQIRRGYTPEEAFIQAEGSYGLIIVTQVKWVLQQYFKNN